MVFKFSTAVSFIIFKTMQANKLANVCLVTHLFFILIHDTKANNTVHRDKRE